MKNYYEILGIEKNASKDDVKRAFRKLASKYHPDKKTGDEAKFKEISEAYAVLGDDTKRAQYDQFGHSYAGGNPGSQQWGGFQSGANGQGFEFDLNDIFENFGDIFGGARGGSRRSARGNDVSVDIELSLKDAVFGTKRTVRLMKNNVCATCAGSGAKQGSEMVTCGTCNGNGKIRETRQSILGQFATVRECTTCSGTGKIPKEKCSTCSGRGVARSEEVVEITIPAGIEHGEMIRMTGRGEGIKDGTPGDLYIKIHVERHPTITRNGDTLQLILPIKLSDALLGGKYTITTLDGQTTLTIPEGIQHGEILRVRGKGVPIGTSRGDFHVKVVLEMPKKLGKTARRLLEELKQEGL